MNGGAASTSARRGSDGWSRFPPPRDGDDDDEDDDDPSRPSRRRRSATVAGGGHVGGGVGVVPVIDMSLPDPDEFGRRIHEACSTVGFFVIVNHGVPEDLRSDMLHQARRFFDELSSDEKQAISVAHSDSYRGYQGMGVNVTNDRLDGHEALDLVSESVRADRSRPRPLLPRPPPAAGMGMMTATTATPSAGLTNYGLNQWPDEGRLPDFRSTTERYAEEMNGVGRRLMAAASRGLGLDPCFFDPYFDDAYWSMRMIRYPPPPVDGNDDGYDFGVGRHTDYGVYTMILCEDVPGTLQIQKRGTTEWVDVDPVPGGFICNLGDMMARWSNNTYVSTPHRVIRSEWQRRYQRDRISIPFFFDPNYDAVISPIEELIAKSNRPACFEPVMYGDHLLARTSKNFRIQ
jgi:isopenicillin N synthase-like dioxygenase